MAPPWNYITLLVYPSLGPRRMPVCLPLAPPRSLGAYTPQTNTPLTIPLNLR